MHYAAVTTWYGALDVATLPHDNALEQRLIHKFNFFNTADGQARILREAHVNFSIFGAVPLELYRHMENAAQVTSGKEFADRQWLNSATTGVSREARYRADDLS